LIVVGTHRRRGSPRSLLGSVAERVVATAPCSFVDSTRKVASRRSSAFTLHGCR
jgi:hypothetical protein